MTTVTATVKKMSGSSVDGFGIVFCYQDENNLLPPADHDGRQIQCVESGGGNVDGKGTMG